MPRRRYKFVPGQGFVPAEDFPPAAFDEYAMMEPGRMGFPRDPRVAAWKQEVMKTAWNLFRSGRARSMSEAMRMAYRTLPKP